MTDIKGKWALVTGASRGLGRLAAELLAEYGCNIILQSTNPDNCAKTINNIEKYGVKAVSIGADFSDMKSVQIMLDKIDKMNVRIDIVLNNAGMQIGYRNDYFRTPVSDYTESFKINTIAPALICYHFMPKMIKNGFGRIVNTTSGIQLEPQQAGYSASKAALDKITVDLGSTVEGTDVMINLTDPGWCRTDLGGPDAPNSPESAVPGIVVGVFADDKKSGRNFTAQSFKDLTPEKAVEKAETEFDSPYKNMI